WLKSPTRRQYDGISFAPSDEFGENCYNIWRGYARTPQKGDCGLFWQHIESNICSGHYKDYQYVRKWLAYVFQHPGVIHTALVLIGRQGVGKNSFVEPIGALLGSHFLHLSSLDELLSHFNYHLKNAVLIFANEALWGGNKKELGTLKAMITDKTCVIEGKGKDRIMLPNYKHLIISSNEDWPVHIDPDDRRFFVLRVGEAHKEDHQYFNALQVQLERGGYDALLFDLLNEDLSEFNPRHLPTSDEAFSIKLLSAPVSHRYIYEALKEGCFDIGNVTPNGVWGNIATRSVFADFRAWCADNGYKIEPEENLGRAIRKLIPSTEKKQDRKIGRRNKYCVNDLVTCRLEFQKEYKAGDCIWF
ncbi:hypothetical protein LCGC14_1027820, partial [marine sediment metagenome]